MKKLIAVLMGVMVLAVGGYADTIIVDQINGPYYTIQEGIDAAFDGDTVLVADGTYTGTGNKNIDFTGKAIEVISENGAENCIINCEDDGRGFYFHSGEDSTSILDGFTITNGYFSGNGGGICCTYPSSPTISNCTISGNSAYYGGGIIYFGMFEDSSSISITNCTVSGNTTQFEGGGITCIEANLYILNTIVEGNFGEYGVYIYYDIMFPPMNTSITYSDFYNNQNVNFYNPPAGVGIITTTNTNGTPCDTYFNIFQDPLFTTGPLGDYYLSQPEGGQAVTSPCVDAGDALVPPNWGTTCTNQGYDIGIIDMGYHYPHIEGVPLPVEMILFTATGGDSKVVIRWITASEFDNDHFNLYRSVDSGSGFQIIAQVPGNGTTSEENEYRYEDCQVVNGITYYYRISDVDINGVEEFYNVTVSATPGGGGLGIVADGYELKQNSPNPFNAGTRIDYTVFELGMVRLVVYDILGKEIAVLVNEMQGNNGYSVVFNAENLSSGIYFYALKVNGFSEVKKMALVK